MNETVRAGESVFQSLLYPTAESYEYHRDRSHLPRISERVCEELGLTSVFGLKSGRLSDYFTEDEEVIRFRQATLDDLLRHPALAETLKAVRPVLDDICGLRLLDRGESAGDSYLYSITEVELYVSVLDVLKSGMAPLSGELKSPAFLRLYDYVRTLTESAYYRELNEQLTALSSRVREIRSVTVGVNLDAELRPVSAGVISVNPETFKSGKTLDKILRLSFKNDSFTTIAPLTPFEKGESENKQQALVGAFHGALEEVYRASVRDWRRIVEGYVTENTDFLLRLLPEIEFVTRAAEVVTALGEKPGCPVAIPTVLPKEKHAFVAKDLYNPRVALAVSDEMVKNDLVFDDKAGIYVLTGPNRGGKSVVTVAAGAVQAFFQLGLPVPAREAALSVADGIFTHFPEGAFDTIDKGRLGEECARLREIFDAATRDSLVLLDESLSSTGAYEATSIASELLLGFAVLGCRGIFSTHLHELAAMAEELSEKSLKAGGVAVDTLVAGMREGERSFRIVRAKPEGKSYAKDIAAKYGLSYEELRQKIENKGAKHA